MNGYYWTFDSRHNDRFPGYVPETRQMRGQFMSAAECRYWWLKFRKMWQQKDGWKSVSRSRIYEFSRHNS